MTDDPREDIDPGEEIPDVRNDPVPEDDPSEEHVSPLREE